MPFHGAPWANFSLSSVLFTGLKKPCGLLKCKEGQKICGPRSSHLTWYSWLPPVLREKQIFFSLRRPSALTHARCVFPWPNRVHWRNNKTGNCSFVVHFLDEGSFLLFTSRDQVLCQLLHRRCNRKRRHRNSAKGHAQTAIVDAEVLMLLVRFQLLYMYRWHKLHLRTRMLPSLIASYRNSYGCP